MSMPSRLMLHLSVFRGSGVRCQCVRCSDGKARPVRPNTEHRVPNTSPLYCILADYGGNPCVGVGHSMFARGAEFLYWEHRATQVTATEARSPPERTTWNSGR